jgi:hypothetical protein
LFFLSLTKLFIAIILEKRIENSFSEGGEGTACFVGRTKTDKHTQRVIILFELIIKYFHKEHCVIYWIFDI